MAQQREPGMAAPRVIWDMGTAFDLFVSLMVLHEPAKYGLRGAWAKGVRARVEPSEREILEQSMDLVWPFHWVHSLPDPRDGATALRILERIPPSQRLAVLGPLPETSREIQDLLQGVTARQTWNDKDLIALQASIQRATHKPSKKANLIRVLDGWARSEEFGEQYLSALQAYHEAFFAEEEARIRPALEEALALARELADRCTLSELLEQLSHGLYLAELPAVAELVLAPSFWSTPLLVFSSIGSECELILFGARPADASLVPGEVVPDALMRALKALGEPTRLRILRYLTQQPQSPTQLARRLRLRTPTVIHHLDTLRMAELVHLTLGKEDKRQYAARPEAVKTAFFALEAFLSDGN